MRSIYIISLLLLRSAFNIKAERGGGPGPVITPGGWNSHLNVPGTGATIGHGEGPGPVITPGGWNAHINVGTGASIGHAQEIHHYRIRNKNMWPNGYQPQGSSPGIVINNNNNWNNFPNPYIPSNRHYNSHTWWRNINFLPGNQAPIYWGGNNYYYHDGTFFSVINDIFHTVLPVLGLIVSTLPSNATLLPGYNNIYTYHGVFYQNYDGQYKVINPPTGACLGELPYFATAHYQNGMKYYEYNNVYIIPFVEPNGAVCYKVYSTLNYY